jgi:hypothetical protein
LTSPHSASVAGTADSRAGFVGDGETPRESFERLFAQDAMQDLRDNR